MNFGTLADVIKFIVLNWSTIKTLIATLQKAFGGDNGKVAECLNGICDAAPKIEKPKSKPKLKDWFKKLLDR